MAGVAGVEPTSAVLETVILPLNHTPKKKESLCLKIANHKLERKN